MNTMEKLAENVEKLYKQYRNQCRKTELTIKELNLNGVNTIDLQNNIFAEFELCQKIVQEVRDTLHDSRMKQSI